MKGRGILVSPVCRRAAAKTYDFGKLERKARSKESDANHYASPKRENSAQFPLGRSLCDALTYISSVSVSAALFFEDFRPP
jgi:hypothetical protein